LFLHPVTPTRAGFSQADGAYVGASLLAEPCFFIRSRQHGPVFPKLTAPLLAPCSRALFAPPASGTKKPAPNQQSPLDDEKEHVRLDQPG